MAIRQEIDPRLDRMYNRGVRCPYCKAKIVKYTTTCERCGVTKKQILEASNVRAKEIIKGKTGEKLIKTRHKPDDITFTMMAIMVFLLGLFGGHHFYAGRKIRGFVQLGCFLGGFVLMIIFPGRLVDGGIELHPVREALSFPLGGQMMFPLDFIFIAALVMWAVDVFAVVFGLYKYPARLAEREKK